MNTPASLGTIHPRAGLQAGVDDRFFHEVNHELSDKGFLTCACRKSNSHIQMMKSAKKWRRQNATNGMYCTRRRRVLVD